MGRAALAALASLLLMGAACAEAQSQGQGFANWRKNAKHRVINDDLCALNPTELVGGYYCLHGDGTATNQTLTPHGAVSITTTVVNNARVKSMHVGMTAADYYTAATYVGPAGDFSMCISYRIPVATPLGTLAVLMTHPSVFSFYTDSNATLYFGIANAASIATQSNTTPHDANAWQFDCVTYHLVGDGNSVLKQYPGGVLYTTNSTAVGPLGDLATHQAFLGINNDLTLFLTADIREVFYTEKALSAATIAAMRASSL